MHSRVALFVWHKAKFQMYIKSKVLKALRGELEGGTQLLVAQKRVGLRSTYTLHSWRKKWPRVDRYVKACEERCDKKRIVIVEDALAKLASEGNATAIIFFLTNRCPERWADKRAVVNNTVVNKVGVNGSNNGFDPELQRRITQDLSRLFEK